MLRPPDNRRALAPSSSLANDTQRAWREDLIRYWTPIGRHPKICLVLPAWATVVVALGASLIGALAGTVGAWFTLRGAQLNIAHEEREASRTRLI
jgi:hypothetical protein